MPFASELMDREPLTVQVELPVPDLARLLLSERLDGVCVVKDGRCVGVVTTMDLIFQEKRVQIPTYVGLLNNLLPVGMRRKEQAMEKVTGATVGEIMSSFPKVVAYDATLEEIATLMVDSHISIVPVVRDDRLVGVISKPDVVRAALAHMGSVHFSHG